MSAYFRTPQSAAYFSDPATYSNAAPVFSVDSVSGGDQPSESWVFALSNASGSGMTANIGGTALTVTEQTSGSITVTIPDLLTFDGGIHRFSENLTVQIVDGASNGTIDTPITPATGFAQVQMPDPISGVWASSTFEAAISPAVLAIGDYIHCTAPTDSDPANGVFPEDSSIVYRIMDMSDPTPAWGTSGTMTIEAAADTTPAAFSFTDATGAEVSTVTESNAITVTGVDSGEDIAVSITGGEYAVSTDSGSTWGAWTSTGTNVQLNHQIKVRGTSSASFSTAVNVVLTVGGVSDTFSITTRAAVTPTIDTQPTNQTVNEGATATFTAAFSNAASIQWYDASNDSALSGETSASLSITTVLADNGNTYYAIATSADSQTAQTNTVTLTVNEVVTAPTMPAATTATVAEGSTAVGTYTASSGDSPITYTLGGTDAASFTINDSTGVVAFASAPDYETKSSYSFTVIATNSAGSDSQAVAVTVTDVAETLDSLLPTPIYVYAQSNVDTDIAEYGTYVGNTFRATVDFSQILANISGAVNSVEWSIAKGTTVTLGDQILESPKAQIEFTSSDTQGVNLIQCTATLDSATVSEFFYINVVNPIAPAGVWEIQ